MVMIHRPVFVTACTRLQLLKECTRNVFKTTANINHNIFWTMCVIESPDFGNSARISLSALESRCTLTQE